VSEELVVRARAGDHEAFERLATVAIDRLSAIAYRVLRDAPAAEDAVQDCLVRAWRDLRALRDPARWDAWLYRLLLNACRDEQRRMRRRPVAVALLGNDVAEAADDLVRVDRRDEVERGLRELSVEHRMTLAMHYYLGLRPVEIARLLGLPEGTVSTRLHYGNRALRAALEAGARASRMAATSGAER
jgi:RNA polymerase sigma-70 factor (ECF subfamily)